VRSDRLDRCPVCDDRHPHAHVEGLEHLRIVQVAGFSQKLEDRQNPNRAEIDGRVEPLRENPVQVARNSAAGNVRQTVPSSVNRPPNAFQ
jgi:propanediol dehydratase large subunit